MEIVMNNFYPQEGDMHNVSVVKCFVQMASVVGINCHLEAYKSPAQLMPKHSTQMSHLF